MDYYVDARESMKWDVSPFKAKEVSAFVATPSNKWSSIDNDDRSLFRSRLHSSPYFGNEKIKRMRPDFSACRDVQSSPHCGGKMQKTSELSSHFSAKLTDDSDSGIYLHQTQFYDTFSSATHSTDSRALFPLLYPGNVESSGPAGPDEQSRPVAKHSFDPLAPPFKPKGTNAFEIKVPLQRSDVMAIDVAKSISTAYQNELNRKNGLGVLGDITNLPPVTNNELVSNGRQQHPEFNAPTASSFRQEKTPTLWGQQYRILEKQSGLFDDSDTFNHDREKRINRSKPLTDPIAINLQMSPVSKPWVPKSFPPVVRELQNAHSQQYELFNENRTTDGSSEIALGSFSVDATQKFGAKPVCIDLRDQDLLGKPPSGCDAQERKVTFADIVRAGMEAINQRQVDQLEMNLYGTASSNMFGEFNLSNGLRDKSEGLDFEDGTDGRASYRPSKYRTEPCTTFHTIGVCPYGSRCNFYHEPNEKKEAPTVSKAMRYKTRLCKTWQKAGECPYGVKCDFAHGTNDLASNSPYRPHYKTRMCKVLQQTGRCPYGAQCTFAHKQGELRTDISLIYKYKTEICKSWALGLECSHGNDCHFAHGEKELNKEPCIDELF